ncbi:MAG TPA: NADH-quinone oxidoreductase subunit NuoH [Acidobacteriota bacterium]|nr:NADH-quinone oxidoreductase subunit NuoH [Acidobacteriota bacterium]HNT16508.1 NADH-quinone oxidoreductase subunit NuoH [Acidobacteriota bacterium]HPA26020.1 NADH-quinone oxidoreductase subunit NuoH [Acidobacteriota bacterium]HQO18983.1 NADH-quinone oxidoreductase subunit NuoH [Acidobacteriota bacterium]HQQ45876.1 NADH-quinone oxidoreductase subunit NuoH [Acidobacteriota bacterium]
MADIILFSAIKIVVVLAVVMGGVAYTTLAERKVSAWLQDRLGPNRVGPFGLLQPIADGIKFFTKEDITPGRSYKPSYFLAPMATLIPALITFAVIPFGESVSLSGKDHRLLIAEGTGLGLVYLLAVSSLGVYGILLAGLSSNNKYSLLGALRSVNQVVSYEVALGLGLIPLAMTAGGFDIDAIVRAQKGGVWFVVPHFIAFIILLVALFAETNRLPFDLPEGESELVGGYHTEYSGMRFAMFFMGEYANMITASALLVLLFFGGWHLPFLNYGWFGPVLGGILSAIVFACKTAFFVFFFIWVRWTLPRFRYDQVMHMMWIRILPLGLAYILVTALFLYLRGPIK